MQEGGRSGEGGAAGCEMGGGGIEREGARIWLANLIKKISDYDLSCINFIYRCRTMNDDSFPSLKENL